MIDIHCHMLPGIDDGPPDLAAALQLARACVADGITHSVLTPHVFPGRFENRRSSIEDDFKQFAKVLAATDIALTLSWAGEVRLAPEALDLLARGELPYLARVEGYDTILLELPDGQIPLGADKLVALLLARQVRPVLVHPERNRAVMEKPERLWPFVQMGCLVQVTAGSLVGQFGSTAQRTARILLDRGWVDVLASDAHNLRGRMPRMRDAADWLDAHYGPAAARELTRDAPARLSGLAAA